jgi:Xaa-Pro aminopeptidase
VASAPQLLAPRLANRSSPRRRGNPGHSGCAAAVPYRQAAGRIEKARRLMMENSIDAMFLEGGTSMFYFTGVRWGARAGVRRDSPPGRARGFRASESRAPVVKFSNDIRVWQEDEGPTR